MECRHGTNQADARGPFAPGLVGRVLERRKQGGGRMRQRNGTGMEYPHGKNQEDTRGHSRWVSNVAFSPDGSKVAAGPEAGTVQVWNIATEQTKQTLEDHSRP